MPLTCSRCRETKPDEDFAWRRIRLNQRDSYCRPCRSAYKKEHYARNKQRYIRQATAWWTKEARRRTEWIVHYLEMHPCVDCGETDPLVLQFDHTGTESKEFNIADGLRARDWGTVQREIAKCEVRCANCHRRRTAAQAAFQRFIISSLADGL